MAQRREAGRREDLIEAATAIVRDSGFGAASVKAVTARAGMSAGLLYSYADGVDDVLAEVFRRCAGTELAAVDQAVVASKRTDAPGRLLVLIETFATRALRGGRLAWALLVEPVGRAIDEERLTYRRGYADILTEIVTQGVREGTFAPQHPAITAAGLVGAIGEALAGPLTPVSADEDDPGAVVAAISELCLRAVGAAPEHHTEKES
ncbi:MULTISPECIES: TetR/AcrR family transcriptional regulator [unclassified Microbacterium]|uniref:TetR/AcrR family transcriptional regulator n=1 Tax=unclassified Microbacterium TaxID=2609290 RepID=UPI0012F79CEC|nr:TetR/AcrR family transcriptional regulator [Microbacterium sp. MAH-37]MVQ42675.1 TetR family transcriptional regulator [Microbacterium sp. MAH-37]